MWCIFYVLCSFGWILFPSPSMKHHCRKMVVSAASASSTSVWRAALVSPNSWCSKGGAAMIVCYFWSDKFIPFGLCLCSAASARQKHLFGLLFFWKLLKNEHPDWGPNKSIHNGFSFVLLNQGFRDFDPGIAMWLEATDGRNPANQLRLVVYHPSLLFTGFCFLHPRWCRIS